MDSLCRPGNAPPIDQLLVNNIKKHGENNRFYTFFIIIVLKHYTILHFIFVIPLLFVDGLREIIELQYCIMLK